MTDLKPFEEMSVRELLDEAQRPYSYYDCGSLEQDDWQQQLEEALRKAVIREASVGEVEVKITEYEDELTSPIGSPDRIVTCGEQFVCQSWIPKGTYRLIKKEE